MKRITSLIAAIVLAGLVSVPLFAMPAVDTELQNLQQERIQTITPPPAPPPPVKTGPVEDPNKRYELVLLHTNDHHGATMGGGGLGSLAMRATYVKSVRAANAQVLLLDAGDINTGSALSNLFAAEPDIRAYNMMKYDVGILGNHEFDGTLEKMLKQGDLVEFPILTSNIKTASGEYLSDPYLIKKYDGFTVGIFGITTLRTKIIASPDPSLVFINEIDAAREMVNILRNEEKVDIIIAITHIGDVKEAPDHITSPDLADAVPGIDIIVDGHSHSFFEKPLKQGNTWIVTANEWGKYVGEGKLTVMNHKLVSFAWEPVQIIAPDPDIITMLAPYIVEANASLQQVVGEAQGDFEFGNRLPRYKETALGNIIADVSAWYFRITSNQHIDFAFHNGGNIRAALPKGPITQEQILTILPFENYLIKASMKGSGVIALFEHIASIPQGAGGFAQMSEDVCYTIDYSSGAGVLKDLTIGGAPVDPNRTYTYVTNDYLFGGGDGYDLKSKAIDYVNTSMLLTLVLNESIEYIEKQGWPLIPYTDGRLTVIGGADL
ncbi:MAG: 5'-nucleotidase C-terminal domain-containing protein [Treponema sp.]|jgi:5'-nucleotidase/UDP-sugar diphosphatase|nr:5'-nucleotidase C-terminal domain-containing protein [Treponema sp.]